MIGADTTFLVELEVLEHPRHALAHNTLRREVLDAGQPLVLVPQVLAEFVHIVTDPPRFANPLTVDAALARADAHAPARPQATVGHAARRDSLDRRRPPHCYI